MKKTKIVLVAFVVMLATLIGGKVSAYDVTVDQSESGHTYETYQVFSGSLSDDGTTLSNIQWGTGVSSAGQTAIQSTYHVNSVQELAEKMSKFTTSEAEDFAKEVAKYIQNPGPLTGLAAGYYLIKDKDDTLANTNKSYTSYILKVVKDETVIPKADVPMVEKKVKDTNDSTGVTTEWQDSADYDINDKVPFKLTATLPANLASYKAYSLELKDTLSSGLTYNKDAKVYLANGDDKADVTGAFTLADDGSSFKINNLKSLNNVNASSKIVVEYTATLNDSAVIGAQGNPNEVSLVYSNNPNFTGKGEESPKGETPKDKVIVFTYQLLVNKVDQAGNPLKGAGFTLYKKDKSGQWHTVQALSAGDASTFSFKGVDDGDYKLSETTTPSGYNSIADIAFSITAAHDSLSDDPKLISLSGNTTSGQAVFSSDSTKGSLSTKIENKKGSILPSTGSIGTTVIYLVGIVLAVSAGILLVARKRAEIKN